MLVTSPSTRLLSGSRVVSFIWNLDNFLYCDHNFFRCFPSNKTSNKLLDFFSEVALVEFHLDDALWTSYSCHDLERINSNNNHYKSTTTTKTTATTRTTTKATKASKARRTTTTTTTTPTHNDCSPLQREKRIQEFPIWSRERKRWLLWSCRLPPEERKITQTKIGPDKKVRLVDFERFGKFCSQEFPTS